MYYTNVLLTTRDPSKPLSSVSNMASYPLPPSPAMIMPPQQSQQPVSWMHTIPSYMPWSVQQRQGNENVMKFTAESSVSLPDNNRTIAVHPGASYEGLPQSQIQRSIFQYKRKGSHLDDAPLPNKLYVSEDKMIAHLNELHISNSYECNPCNDNQELPCSETPRQPPARSLEELEGRLALDIDEVDDSPTPSSSNEGVIVLSPELRQLQKASNILPSAILEKIQKPSMELVLWKPPGGIVDSLIKAVTHKSTDGLNSEQHRKPINNSRNNNNNSDNMNHNDKSRGRIPISVNFPAALNERLNNTASVPSSTPSSVLTTRNILLEGVDDDDMEL